MQYASGSPSPCRLRPQMEPTDTDGRSNRGAKLSPTALNQFLACEHRTYLDILDGRGSLGETGRPPDMQLMFVRGDQFEDSVVEEMRGQGLTVISVEKGRRDERAEQTLTAMRDGA